MAIKCESNEDKSRLLALAVAQWAQTLINYAAVKDILIFRKTKANWERSDIFTLTSSLFFFFMFFSGGV